MRRKNSAPSAARVYGPFPARDARVKIEAARRVRATLLDRAASVTMQLDNAPGEPGRNRSLTEAILFTSDQFSRGLQQ